MVVAREGRMEHTHACRSRCFVHREGTFHSGRHRNRAESASPQFRFAFLFFCCFFLRGQEVANEIQKQEVWKNRGREEKGRGKWERAWGVGWAGSSSQLSNWAI